MAIKLAKKYPWRKGKYTLEEISNIHFEETAEMVTVGCLSWRINSRGSVEGALDFEDNQKDHAIKYYDCPDDISRSHVEIAEFKGITLKCWQSRFYRFNKNIKKSFNYIPKRKFDDDALKENAPKSNTPDVIQKYENETERVARLLDAIPSATKYETELHEGKQCHR